MNRFLRSLDSFLCGMFYAAAIVAAGLTVMFLFWSLATWAGNMQYTP